MTPRWDPPGKLTWLKGKAEVAPGSVFHTMVSITLVAMVLLNIVAMVGKRIFSIKMTAVRMLITQAETMMGALRHSISLVPQEPEDITNFTCIAR